MMVAIVSTYLIAVGRDMNRQDSLMWQGGFALLSMCFVANAKAATTPVRAVTPAEQWVMGKIANGEVADLRKKFKSVNQRTISAEHLRQLIARPKPLHPNGVRIIGAVVTDPLVLNYVTVSINVALKKCQFLETVSLHRARFERELNLSSSEFQRTDFRSITVKGDLLMESAVFHQGIRLSRATILGYVDADKCRLGTPDHGATLYGAHIGRSLFLADAVSFSLLNLRSAKVEGDVDLTRTKLHEDVDFRHLRVNGVFYLHRTQFEGGADSIRVRGMSYRYLTNAAQTRKDIESAEEAGLPSGEDPAALTKLLMEKAEYSADAYARLEKYLVEHGYRKEANALHIDGKWREFDTLGWLGKAKSLFLWATVGHGRRPWLVFVWCGVIIAFGCFVFRPSKDRVELQSSDDCWRNENYNRTWCFWYSVDLIIPAVNLRAADVWKPRSDAHWCARSYARLHCALGWILIPVGIAAITGILSS